MKILILFPRFGIGGIAKMSSYLANTFHRHGHNVVCVSMSNEDNMQQFDPGIRLVNLPYEKNGGKITSIDKIIFFFKYRRFLSKEHFDWAIVLGTDLVRITVLASMFLNLPIIGSERGNPYLYSTTAKEKYIWALKKCNKLVFQTEEARAFYPSSIRNKGAIIPNPCYIKRGKIINSDLSKPIILVVSRLGPEKNIIGIIKAFSYIQHQFSDYELHIYGDGQEKEMLATFVNNNGIRRVTFFTTTVNPFEEAVGASLYVLNSDSEGMPNSLIEAMMYGIPCIATDCPPGGVRFLADGGRRACLVPVRDDKALANAMQKVLSDYDYRDSLITNARELITELDPEVIGNQWLGLLDEL